jgi:hypothetical protein
MCRKKILTILASVLVFGGSASAAIEFNDGGYHVIDYVINDEVKVDYDRTDAGTQIEIVSGGWLTSGLDAYGTSMITIDGGRVDNHFLSDGYNRVIMYSGIVQNIGAGDNSKVEIYGGEITEGIYMSSFAIITGGTIGNISAAGLNGRITMSGGTVLEDIGATWYGLVTLIGNDFQINGHNVGYRDFASTYATPGIDPWGYPWLTGTVSGILESGDVVNNNFVLYHHGDITFIPEPGTLLLLLFGSMFLKKQH